MSNSTTCEEVGEDLCWILYGVVASMISLLCYSCFRGCAIRESYTPSRSPINIPQITVRDSSAYESPCAVCIQEIADDDEICRLPCGHYFHPQCIHPWLAIQQVCPLCKLEVTQEP